MQNTTDKKNKWVGYSEGKTYPVFGVKNGSKGILGLCEIEGYLWMQWCLFEKIEKI